ncbi:ubiquitin-conjugating enzyme E2 25 [Pyrus ussuriensis x Pyrus communis]|uniref:E2 ubiquitin-conjugating enzyme n=1 Tax=Pyrus ussuriensis x Pyrus communis TaxID=2448454 RepID=A0A5N5GL67_9ROSA|nr:probable ubiquitin-conjugating enzyme E2 25 [Pyrus x bretschneideri]KAB2615887.1 ubiquitin-conjugating enzyme E2 25 [Pyrus ussuriensis x Pyrus communis]
MEPPPLHTNTPRNSKKKRLFSDRGSGCMDSDDVMEIPPPATPITRAPKFQKLKLKEVIRHDVIEIDEDEDSVAAMLIDDRVDKKAKGKAIENSSDDYYDYKYFQEDEVNSFFGPSVMATPESANGIEANKGFVPANVINLDGHTSDLSYEDDDFADPFLDEFMDVDEYAQLQAHFDNVDIPPGIEAPIPWLSDPPKIKVNSVSGSSSVNKRFQMQQEPDHFIKMPIFGGSSSLKTQIDSISHPPEVNLSSAWKLPKTARSKKKQPASQHQGSAPNLPVGKESSKSQWLLGPFQSKKKVASSSSSTNQFDAMTLGSGADTSSASYFHNILKKKGSSAFYKPMPVPGWPGPISKFNTMPFNSSLYDLDSLYSPGEVAGSPWIANAQIQNNLAPGGISTSPGRKISAMEMDEMIVKFKGFKKFDTVEDHSDHHYSRCGYSPKQPPKSWAKRIQEEWKILEKDLPDTIFVRAYETRMDLLRAVIVGAEGTPYHDGLFFFDVCFPCGYPNVPPNVYYHSGGLRLNPNLYNCGKVCLSLLNTWSGNKNEKWLPGVSTMLQVLVSIQGLILNTKPYFNEPGYANTNGSAAGEKRSEEYNENTFILSLKTMVYSMRRPPKHFEDLVLGHFYNRARDILVACKAYMDGAQVGCLVKGGVQDVDEGDKSCSQRFKTSVADHVPMIVAEFTRIGVKDCERFVSPTTSGNNQIASMPQAATSMISC